MVTKVLSKLNMRTFRYREYQKEFKNFAELIASFPSFLMEVLFNFLVQVIRATRNLIRKYRLIPD